MGRQVIDGNQGSHRNHRKHAHHKSYASHESHDSHHQAVVHHQTIFERLLQEFPTLTLTMVVLSAECELATGRPLNLFCLRKLHARRGTTFCTLVADGVVRRSVVYCCASAPCDLWPRTFGNGLQWRSRNSFASFRLLPSSSRPFRFRSGP